MPWRGDRRAHVVVERRHRLAGQILVAVEQRKGPFLAGKIGRGEIGGAPDRAHPLLGQPHRLPAAVAGAAQDQRVGESGDAEADPSLGPRLRLVLGKRIARDLDDVVHHPHGDGGQLGEPLAVDVGLRPERILDEARQVDRAEQACPVWGQRLFPTWVSAVDGFAIPQIVAAVDAIDEHHPRLGVGVGGAHDLVPQLTRLQALVRDTLEGQLPRRVLLHRLHEGVGHQHRQVEHAQATALALRLDERLDIRMIATHHRHHRPAAGSGAHDGPAHRVPHVHERQGARRVGADAFHRRALRSQSREVVADAAPLLHRQRRLLQVLENPPHVVGDVAHDEAVEQRDPPTRTGAGENAAGGQELEILHRREEPLFPDCRIRLGSRELSRHPPPGIVDGLVEQLSVQRLQAILHVPDLLRNGCHLDHGYLDSVACWCAIDGFSANDTL